MKSLIFFIAITCSGCSTGFWQRAAIVDAYESFENGRYNKTLNYVMKAETVAPLDSAMEAELTFLKANAMSKLGLSAEADSLYRYISENHPQSKYAYLAKTKIGGPSN